jgi:aryl-alcohol dehydrogenase-like predicted oxidoreductase
MGDRKTVARRPLGRTGLAVSPIGFGAFKIGRNQGVKYPSGYDLPDEAAVATLLGGVLDLGINYVDTAPAYGLSEARIGRALAGRDFVLSTKVGETFEDGRSTYDFSAEAVRASVERSRARLGRERLELVFIHAHADDVAILRDTPVVATLAALQRDGLIGAIGFSGKTVPAARLALDFADVLMIEYHLEDRSHAEIIAEAARRGVGVVVKKGLASGRLPAADAIAFVLGTAGVCSLVIGGLDLHHIRENLAIAERAGASR